MKPCPLFCCFKVMFSHPSNAKTILSPFQVQSLPFQKLKNQSSFCKPRGNVRNPEAVRQTYKNL